jgi:hypothetical protein
MTSIIGIQNPDNSVSYVYIIEAGSGFKVGLDLVEKYNNSRKTYILIKYNLQYKYDYYDDNKSGIYFLKYDTHLPVNKLINLEYIGNEMYQPQTKTVIFREFMELKTDDINYLYLYQEHKWRVLF